MKNIFAFLLLFVIALLMNVFTPMSVADDGAYAFVKLAEGREFDTSRFIGSLGDIVESMVNHWHSHNGRIVCHSLLQFFIGIAGQLMLCVVNAAIFTAVFYLLLSITGYKDKHRFVPMVFLAFLLLMPAFNETTLWKSGTFNYLWTAFFILVFFGLLKKYWDDSLSMKHWLWCPLAFICGWTHEALTLPVSMTLALFGLFNIRKIWGRAVMPIMIAFVLGTAMNVLAPATFIRADAGDVGDVMVGALGKVKQFAVQMSRLRVFWLTALLGLVMLRKNKPAVLTWLKNCRWLITVTVFSLLPILLAGMPNGRVRFGTEFFSLILLLALLRELGVERMGQKVNWVCGVLTVLMLVPIFYFQKKNYDNFLVCEKQMKQPGQTLILTPRDDIPDFWCQYLVKHVDFGEDIYYLAADKDKTMVRYMSAIYGKQGMHYLPRQLYDDICQHPQRYTDFSTLPGVDLYAKKVEDAEKTYHVSFDLAPCSRSLIPFYLRPVAKLISIYSSTTCEPSNLAVVEVNCDNYLVVPKPIKGMRERVAGLKVYQ